MNRFHKIIDMTGEKYEKLTVVEFSHMKHGNSHWKCRCICGKECVVSRCSLKSGDRFSCGCYRIYKYKRGESGLKKLYIRYKVGAAKNNRDFDLSLEEFKGITSENCAYCGRPPGLSVSLRNKHEDELMEYATYVHSGIDRIDSTRGYKTDNVVPCCKWCNIAKGNRTIKEFKEHIDRICRNITKG